MDLTAYEISDKLIHDGVVMYKHIRSGFEMVEKTVPIKRGIEEINIMKVLHSNAFPQMIDFRVTEHNVKIYMNRVMGVTFSEAVNDPVVLSTIINHLDIVKFNCIHCLKILHNEGIIHRDVKPDNLMIDDALNVHLIDFGVACFDSSESLSTTLIGTYGYMSPEMIFEGDSIGKESDYYALGKSLLFLIEKQKQLVSEELYEEILELCEIKLDKRKKNIERL